MINPLYQITLESQQIGSINEAPPSFSSAVTYHSQWVITSFSMPKYVTSFNHYPLTYIQSFNLPQVIYMSNCIDKLTLGVKSLWIKTPFDPSLALTPVEINKEVKGESL